MLNFFQNVIEYLELLFSFVTNIVLGLVNLLSAVATSLSIPTALSGYVFAPLSASILAVVAFSVIKLIVGRENI